MDQTRIMRASFVAALTALVTTVVLSACNDGGDGVGRIGSGGGSGVGPSSSGNNDAFVTQVATVAANTPDNTDPESTDSIVATSSETVEPATVVF